MLEKFDSAPAVRASAQLRERERDDNTHLHAVGTGDTRVWQGLRGSAPDSPGERQRVMGFLQKGEALEDEQCSEAKESGGSIRREEKGRCGKGREDRSQRHAHAWRSGVWRSECRVTPGAESPGGGGRMAGELKVDMLAPSKEEHILR